MRVRSLFAATSVLVTAAATLIYPPSVASASTEAQPVVKMAFFNSPLTYQTNQVGGPSAVTAAILELMADATNGATVDIAVFTASLSDDLTGEGDASLIKQEIVNDLKRGIHFNVVADAHKPHDLWDAVANEVAGTWMAYNFKVYYCQNSCYRSGIGIMHNKFMMVNYLTWDGAPMEGAVLQMSANWNYRQLNSHHWNNAVEVVNDVNLYSGFSAYWSALKGCASLTAHTCTGTPPSAVQSWSGSTNIWVNALPQSTPDPVQNALANVEHCGSATDPLNTHTNIDIAVNTWAKDPRGNDILSTLRQYDANACPVRIVIPATANIASELDGTDSLSLKAHCTGGALVSGNSGTKLAPTEHNKYMLIKGSFQGAVNSVVFTGSHRFNAESMLDDDEIWMRFVDAALYSQYEAAFNEMWNAAPPCSAVQLNPVGTDDDDLDP